MHAYNLIDTLPKAELHVHLRGAIPPDVLCSLMNKYRDKGIWQNPVNNQIKLLAHPVIGRYTLDREYREVDLQGLFKYSCFEDFLLTYTFVGYYIRSAEDFRLMVQGVVRALASRNIVYAEITAVLNAYLNRGIAFDDICACFDEAAHDERIKINWLIDPVRNHGPENAMELLKLIERSGCDSIKGITIGGEERSYPSAVFAEAYAYAKSMGLGLSVHSGEVCGAEAIWETIHNLQPDRIGHGVRAYEDKKLVEYLAHSDIPLEICPTSNICTNIYPSLAEHPIKDLIESGVKVTVNTDDPAFFGTNLTQELINVLNMGISLHQLREIMTNAYRCAFTDAAEKERLINAFNTAWMNIQVNEHLK